MSSLLTNRLYTSIIYLMGRWKTALLVMLIAADCGAALYFSSANQIDDWNECVYVINSFSVSNFLFHSQIPVKTFYAYASPLLPVIIAVFGKYSFLINVIFSALSALLVFFILRRISNDGFAFLGIFLFMLSDKVRIYDIHIMTELPSICLILLSLYIYYSGRSVLLLAISIFLSFLMRWNLALLLPCYLLAYLALKDRRRFALLFAYSAAFATLFCIASMLLYGDPLRPIRLTWAAIHEPALLEAKYSPFSFYARASLSVFGLPLMIISLAGIVYYAIRAFIKKGSCPAAIFTILAVNLAALFTVTAKEPRYLVPFLPLVIIFCVKFLYDLFGRVQAIVVILMILAEISLIGGRECLKVRQREVKYRYRKLYASETMRQEIAKLGPDGTLYTDLFWLSVMANFRHETAIVWTPSSEKEPYQVVKKGLSSLDALPRGALFLTEYAPVNFDVIAKAQTVLLARKR